VPRVKAGGEKGKGRREKAKAEGGRGKEEETALNSAWFTSCYSCTHTDEIAGAGAFPREILCPLLEQRLRYGGLPGCNEAPYL